MTSPASIVISAPPWSGSEQEFIGNCRRCDTCITACPEHILRTDDKGFPHVDFRRGECTFCAACVTACDNQTLHDADTSPPWALAASINSQCLPMQGVVCGRCTEICEHMAIHMKYIAGGFNTAMELSNTETFCISCHEMKVNVYEEYKTTIHYNNRSGVRATCPDCHVPKEWHWKVLRKIRASNELFHKVLGSVNTPEKFEAKRLQLARNVWKSMKSTDSRECRNCHDFKSMDYARQGRRAVNNHTKGFDSERTCIDCHKGIAHRLPAMYQEDPSMAFPEDKE